MASFSLFLIVPGNDGLFACPADALEAGGGSWGLLGARPIGWSGLRTIPGLGEDPNSLDTLPVSPLPIGEGVSFVDMSWVGRVLMVRGSPGNLARTLLIPGLV